ncbi:DUF294 nucleotidyltransferase-like domain-containing protein [Bacillus solimangrovi]|uniref:Signal transduction protein n=1 Tax=Bacillus solimangrovi TaxID=1305675 RepID=A0A1E5LH08_9BACI|nr:DUF294 nucleotidyltransferase-like domain-containing protein [Bacillus solimangrovi]OEH93336.1 signal transduction protein [Bacillus solimangrovi]
MKTQKKQGLDKEQIYQYVKGHPFFRGMAFSQVIQLLEQCEIQEYHTADVIFQVSKPRKGIILLLEGVAEIYLHHPHDEHIEVLEVVQSGGIIGFVSLANFIGVTSTTRYDEVVESRAIEETIGLYIPFEVLEQRWEDNSVQAYLLRSAVTRLNDIYISLGEQIQLAQRTGESERFMMRVQDLMTSPPLTVPLHKTVSQAASLMVQNKTSSVLVMEDGELVGIVTEQDLVKRFIVKEKSYGASLADIMTTNVEKISRFDYYYDALTKMILKGFKHLPVVDENDNVVGVVTFDDLMRKRNESMVKTIQRVEGAKEESLSSVKNGIYTVLETMINDEVPMTHTLQMVTSLYDRLVKRCVQLAVDSLKEKEGLTPPVAFSWYQMGSSGREEQFILTDQDHFLVYDNGLPEQEEDIRVYFEKLGSAIVEYLEVAGYERCKGKMMASEELWRGSLSRWQTRLRQWILQSTNDNILLAQNFFSFRKLYGDDDLHERFIIQNQEMLERSKIFLYRMAEVEKEHQVPSLEHPIRALFRLERKKIDIKKEILFPFHHSLQILSLAYGVVDGTPLQRITMLVEKGVLKQEFATDLKVAFNEIMNIYVRQKWSQHKREEETSSILHFVQITTREKDNLMLTLKTFRELQSSMLAEFSMH